MKTQWLSWVVPILLVGMVSTSFGQESTIVERLKSLSPDKTLPNDVPTVFAPGIISKSGIHLHSAPAISPDGQEIFISAMTPKPEFRKMIYHLRWEGDHWSELLIAPFSGTYNDDSPVFSPDGKKLFFASNRPPDTHDQSDDLDFWFLEKKGAHWGTPVQAASILSSGTCDFRMSFSAYGNIFFSSDRVHGKQQSFDIFSAQKQGDNFINVRPLENTVNSTLTEQIAVVAPDESYIIFYRYTRNEPEQVGLYISFKNEDGSWSRGKNMGALFNSPASAVTQAASLSPDGNCLFFLRRREESVYWVDARIVDTLR